MADRRVVMHVFRLEFIGIILTWSLDEVVLGVALGAILGTISHYVMLDSIDTVRRSYVLLVNEIVPAKRLHRPRVVHRTVSGIDTIYRRNCNHRGK